jgi:cardiolipin synthase
LQWLYFGWGSSSPRSNESLELMSALVNHPRVEADLTVRHDHSKYYVFDDTRLILGGINVEDKGAGFDLKKRYWRDYMVEVTGANLVRAFLARESSPIRLNRRLSAQFVFNAPKGRVARIRRLVMRLLSEARESVVIEMAYFGDRVLAKKIIQTINRGIKVTIISAEHPNVQRDLNRRVLRDIITQTRGKVRLCLSRDMIHSKMVCVDNQAFLVGSANFNRQSPLTGEAAVLLRGQLPEFSEKIQESIGRNLDKSRQIRQASELEYSRLRAFVESLFC